MKMMTMKNLGDDVHDNGLSSTKMMTITGYCCEDNDDNNDVHEFAEDDEDDDNGAGCVVTGACDTY